MNPTEEYNEIDPALGQMLELLKTMPERDPVKVQLGHNRFISELDVLFPVHSANGHRAHRELVLETPKNRRLPVFNFARQPAFALALVIVAALFLLLTTGVITARASEDSLPGDVLYPVKTGLEQARLAVTTSPPERLNLYLQYADRRLREANALLEVGRYEDVKRVVTELEANVRSADNALREVERRDPERGRDLKTEMVMRLAGISVIVNNLTTTAPPVLQPVLQSSLTSIEDVIVEGSERHDSDPSSFSSGDPGDGAASDGPADGGDLPVDAPPDSSNPVDPGDASDPGEGVPPDDGGGHNNPGSGSANDNDGAGSANDNANSGSSNDNANSGSSNDNANSGAVNDNGNGSATNENSSPDPGAGNTGDNDNSNTNDNVDSNVNDNANDGGAPDENSNTNDAGDAADNSNDSGDTGNSNANDSSQNEENSNENEAGDGCDDNNQDGNCDDPPADPGNGGNGQNNGGGEQNDPGEDDPGDDPGDGNAGDSNDNGNDGGGGDQPADDPSDGGDDDGGDQPAEGPSDDGGDGGAPASETASDTTAEA